MSLQINGNIESKISSTNPTRMDLGCPSVLYSEIIEYTFNRSNLDDLISYKHGGASEDEMDTLLKVIAYLEDGNETCTISIES